MHLNGLANGQCLISAAETSDRKFKM